MTLKQAIKILKESVKVSIPDYDQDERNAVNLGIEAMKRLIELRRYRNQNPKWILPGETLEGKEAANYGQTIKESSNRG